MKPMIFQFLDLKLSSQSGQLEFHVYRKIGFTDLIVPIDCCRPLKHKKSCIVYLMNRVNNYLISL
jgi:hypothetical protein